MEERYELKEEEVNVYTAECGKIQEFCLQDCIDGSAWLSIIWEISETKAF